MPRITWSGVGTASPVRLWSGPGCLCQAKGTGFSRRPGRARILGGDGDTRCVWCYRRLVGYRGGQRQDDDQRLVEGRDPESVRRVEREALATHARRGEQPRQEAADEDRPRETSAPPRTSRGSGVPTQHGQERQRDRAGADAVVEDRG